MLQLLDARALDLRLFARGTRVAIEFLPALLPVLHRLFGLRQRRRRCALALARGGQPGSSCSSSRAQLVDLRLVARQMQIRFGGALLGLLEILALALAQLAGVLNRLLGARDLGADLVVATLHAHSALRTSR